MTDRQSGGWLGNRKIQTKLLLAFGAILLAFLLAVVAIMESLQAQADARERSMHSREVIDEISDAQRNLQAADIFIRDLHMSGGTKVSDQYHAYLDDSRQHLDKLLALTIDNGAQQARLRQIQDMLARWIEQTAKPAVEAHASLNGSADYAQKSFEAGARYLEGTNAELGKVMDLFDDTRAAERRLLVERDDILVQKVGFARAVIVGMFAFGVLVAILALWMSSRLITRPVRRITDLMTQLAEGNHAIKPEGEERRDEIGAIARALLVFKRNSIANSEQGWVKANVAEISARLQATKTAEEFARTLTTEIAPRIKAGVALFFASQDEGGALDLRGSYGFRQRKHLGTRYAPGEGLVGQVALERKAIVLDQLPDDYITIHSGIGEATPRQVIALPLLLQERLLGVLEFGSFAPFGKAEQALLEETMPIAALSLENIQRAQRTQELLARTQTQARELQASEEELRVQQEELTATNEELQAKTTELVEQQQRLRASEEELRVQAEELQASNEELRQKSDTLNEQKQTLAVLQQDTERKADQLARASQYKSDFLANMSHELRTPLNSLLILSRNLADNGDGNLDEDQVESARVIHESGTNLLRLINDILDLSKIEAGKMQIVGEEFRLQHLAQTLLRHFNPVASEKGLQFEVQVGDNLPAAVFTDGARLEQIANNLIGNAFKFTREGAVTVRIERPSTAAARRIGVDAEQAFAFIVTDTGIGIPPDKIEHIFGAFEQMDASTSRNYGGSGLGLAIARRLAQMLGGEISLSSEPGQGSTFSVVLPTRIEVPEQDAAAQAPVEIAHAPPTPPAAIVPTPWIPDDRDVIGEGDTVILAIEDDALFARTLVDMIRRKGHRALAAGNGESGLYLARQYRPTGILLDVMLPGIDGWTVIERLKRDPVTRQIPVHFVSGTDESLRARDVGAIGFLTKPVERDALLEALEHLLQSAPHGPRRMLLVDDDADSRMAVTSLLDGDKIEIVEAQSGEDALALLDEKTFDCIVLDLGLPGMSGFDLVERVAARPGPVPPLIVHSGRELTRDESARLRQHTDSIVMKGARSLERLLDEISLFLHSVRKNAPPRIVRDMDSGLHGRTVLVVDDDMRNVFALSKILREKGLNVVMAQDGHKALRQVDENKSIEIVLMDVMMPGMDGYETTREIRKRPSLSKLPIIAVTAKAMAGDREKCLEAGANDYLAKPIDIDKLLSMMRIWLHA